MAYIDAIRVGGVEILVYFAFSGVFRTKRGDNSRRGDYTRFLCSVGTVTAERCHMGSDALQQCSQIVFTCTNFYLGLAFYKDIFAVFKVRKAFFREIHQVFC